MEERDRSKEAPLINTMTLLETKKQMPVPNHLLETKVYTKLGHNSIIHANPHSIHFDGFEINKKHVKKLTILNTSSDVLNIHVIPPQSKYLTVKYTKKERMVPGLSLECIVEFTPDEWRYYYDCIRINCPGEENLIIPIHGYPVMSTKDFPRLFTFPATPVGHRISCAYPLCCMAPVDFEYELAYIQEHPAFTIHPMSGIVQANSEVKVTVTFAPLEFETATMIVQLNISQFNAKPIICKFIGLSKPGLLRENTSVKFSQENLEMFDPRCVSPLHRSRYKQKTKKKDAEPSFLQKPEFGELQFPAVIDSPYAVAQVLNQESGRMRAKDVRKNLMNKQDKTEICTHQIKEIKFEQSVHQNIYEERQNQLCWQVKLGDEIISNKQRMQVLDTRRQFCSSYKYTKQEDSLSDEEYKRKITQTSFRRTIRHVSMLIEKDVHFDPYTNDTWTRRHLALSRFIQIAGMIIIRNRVAHKLSSLQQAVIDWNKRNYFSNLAESVDKDLEVKNHTETNGEKEMHLNLCLSAHHIQHLRFPTYVPPDIKDDMAADALGRVTVASTHIVVKQKNPFFDIQVPRMYQTQHYEPFCIHDSLSGYVSYHLLKTLRTGAKDEVIVLPQTAIAVEIENGLSFDIPQMTVLDSAPLEEQKVSKIDMEKTSYVSSVKPPGAFFRPIKYPALHIMNPAPGLQSFETPMPYAEVDFEFHLCTLPRYFRRDFQSNPHAATQRRYLEHEDTIRGMMNWKKFPSQSLISLTSIPTLTNTWVPRWGNNFSTFLLPNFTPSLFNGLAASDSENIEKNDSDADSYIINLNPEMISAQFAIVRPGSPLEDRNDIYPFGNKMPLTNIPVGPQGPLLREKREEELEYFMTKKYNSLGAKVTQRIASLNSQLNQPELVLC